MTGILLMVLGATLLGIGGYIQFKPQDKETENTNVTKTEETKTSSPNSLKEYKALQMAKGTAFEKYLVSKFNKDYFKILEWTGDKSVDGQFSQSNLNPDLVISLEFKNEKYPFAVECKWRKAFKEHQLRIATEEQLKRYSAFSKDRKLPTFIAIGVGGIPSNPEHLYMVPIQRLRYERAKEEYLSDFEVATLGKLFYDYKKECFK